jgi:hypothetical protein
MGNQTFEGQAAGTAFTATTSGTGGNTAYASRNLGTGGVMVYSGAAPLPAAGTMGLKMTPGGATSILVQRNVASLTQHAVRFFIGWSVGAQAHNFYGLRNSGSKVVGVQTESNGLFMVDVVGGVKWTSTVAAASNTLYRVEVVSEVGTTTTNGRVRVWIYLGNTSTLVDSYDSGYTSNLGTTAFAFEQVGKLGATAETTDIYLDEHAWSDTNTTTPIGPVATAKRLLRLDGLVSALAVGGAAAARAYLGTAIVFGEGSNGTGNEGDGFVHRLTEPTEFNSGAGRMPGRVGIDGLEVVNGNVTIAAGETVSDKWINGFVDMVPGARLRNCYVAGPATQITSGTRPLVRVTQAPTAVGGTRAEMEYVTIRPQTPSARVDGVGYRSFHMVRSIVQDTTDGWGFFADNGSNGLVNVLVEDSALLSLVQFRPDVPINRSHTHNDGAQGQYNSGGENDAVWDGCSINPQFVTYAGTQPLETPVQHQAAFMVSPNAGLGDRVYLKVQYSWLYGGVYTVNSGTDTNDLGGIWLLNNRFERPGAPGVPAGNPEKSIVIDASMPRTVSGNTYMDTGDPVPVSNG